MFTALHALAQKSTLMVVITAEGDELRVCVTPTPKDSKDESKLRPLTLVGTALELDTDFDQAIAIWQAPKQSILEQATAAAAPADDEEAPTAKDKASKAAPKPGNKAAKPASTKADHKKAPKASKAAGKPAATAKLDPAKPWPLPGEGAAGPSDAGAAALEATTGDQSTSAEAGKETGTDPGTDLPPATEPVPVAPAAGNDSAPAADPTPIASSDSNPAQDDFTLQLF